MSDQTDFTRRQLLAAAGAAPLRARHQAAPCAQTAQGQPMPGDARPQPAVPGEQMRWAIVGLGSFGVNQVIPGFADARQSRMTAFVSGNPQKARTLGARHGVSRFYDYANFDTMKDDAEIDCVYIVLPVGLHAEYTVRALEAGKHVLCEKPMASTAAECERMVAAAKANNRQLGVAYRVHFEPTNLEAKQPHRRRRARRDPRGAQRPRVQRQPCVPAAQVAAREGARRRRLDVRHRHLRAQHLADDARGRHPGGDLGALRLPEG